MRAQTAVMPLGSFLVAAPCLAGSSDASAQPIGVRRKIVHVGAATIHVTLRGQGDPIVFIPSLGRGVEDFDELSDRLARAGYQAVLPAPRGIGASAGPLIGLTTRDFAEDIAAVIRSLGLGPVTLVGHAYGNRLARIVATAHPDLVKRVVLLAAGGMIPMSPDIARIFRRVFDPSLSKEMRLAAIQRAFFAPGHDANVWEDGWYFDVARAQAAGIHQPPLEQWWGGGVAPLLVLQATDDVVAISQNSAMLAAEFPHRVTVVAIPDSGHAMLPEQPERIAAAILAYLRR